MVGRWFISSGGVNFFAYFQGWFLVRFRGVSVDRKFPKQLGSQKFDIFSITPKKNPRVWYIFFSTHKMGCRKIGIQNSTPPNFFHRFLIFRPTKHLQITRLNFMAANQKGLPNSWKYRCRSPPSRDKDGWGPRSCTTMVFSWCSLGILGD